MYRDKCPHCGGDVLVAIALMPPDEVVAVAGPFLLPPVPSPFPPMEPNTFSLADVRALRVPEVISSGEWHYTAHVVEQGTDPGDEQSDV